MLCYGCGENLTSCERYNLYTTSHKKVLSIWKRLVTLKLRDLEIPVGLDCILNEDDATTGRICRKCYSHLERLEKLESVVIPKISNAVNAILAGREDDSHRLRSLAVSSRKRHRSLNFESGDEDSDSNKNDDEQTVPVLATDIPVTPTGSPNVAVSFVVLVTCNNNIIIYNLGCNTKPQKAKGILFTFL